LQQREIAKTLSEILRALLFSLSRLAFLLFSPPPSTARCFFSKTGDSPVFLVSCKHASREPSSSRRLQRVSTPLPAPYNPFLFFRAVESGKPPLSKASFFFLAGPESTLRAPLRTRGNSYDEVSNRLSKSVGFTASTTASFPLRSIAPP